MKSTIKLLLIAILCLLGSIWTSLAAKDPYTPIIKQGQKQLRALLLYNELHPDEAIYILRLTYTAEQYPNAEFIRQKLSIDDDKSTQQTDYMLDPEELERRNKQLQQINQTAKIKTYLLLVNNIPLYFEQALPEYRSVSAVIRGFKQPNPQSVVDQEAIRVKRAAEKIINGVTEPFLKTQSQATLFCSLVCFKAYRYTSEGKGLRTFGVCYPRSTQLAHESSYRHVLEAKVRKTGFLSDRNVAVGQLIDVIEKSNQSYTQTEALLTALFNTQNPEETSQLLTQLSEQDWSILSLSLRIHLLKVLSKGSMPDQVRATNHPNPGKHPSPGYSRHIRSTRTPQ